MIFLLRGQVHPWLRESEGEDRLVEILYGPTNGRRYYWASRWQLREYGTGESHGTDMSYDLTAGCGYGSECGMPADGLAGGYGKDERCGISGPAQIGGRGNACNDESFDGSGEG